MQQVLKSTAVTYSLKEHLGEGLNSVVYRAIRTDPFHHMRQTVALKILKSKNLVEIWKREFVSLERVVCKHCVRVFGFEWVEDRPALVLEFVNGISLRQLGLSGPIPPPLAIEILAQVQVGLCSLRSYGVCHGDLSPNNIMIDEAGSVRLLDFGWANGINGSVQTTHAFAAPELLAGARPSFETDLYSLGVIEKMLLDNESPRLNPSPADRPEFSAPPCPKRQSRLARRVRIVRDHHSNFLQMATRSLFVARKAGPPIYRWLFSIGLFLSAPNSECRAKLATELALLKVRTMQWTHVKVDDVEIGFSPQDVYLIPFQAHQITWKTGQSGGTMLVRLGANDIRIIRDEDLGP